MLPLVDEDFSGPAVNVFEYSSITALKGQSMSADRVCPACGSSIKPAMLKCMDCGTRLTAGEATQPARQPGTTSSQLPTTVGVAPSASRVRVVGRSSTARPRTSARPQAQSEATTQGAVKNQPAASTLPQTPVQQPVETQPASVTNVLEQATPVPGAATKSSSAAPSQVASQAKGASAPRKPPVSEGDSSSGHSGSTRKSVVKPDGRPADHRKLFLEAVRSAIASLSDADDASEPGKALSRRKLKSLTADLEVEDATSRSESMARRAAILELGKSRDRRAFELIEPFHSDSWEIVRRAVAVALGELGDSRGTRVLLELLTDSDADVVRESIKALRLLGNPAAIRPLLLIGLDNHLLKMQVGEAVSHLGAAGIDELIRLADSKPLELRKAAISALGRIKDDRVGAFLMATLDSCSPTLRPTVIKALGRLGDRKAISRVIRLLSDSDARVCLSAIQALCRMPDKRAVRPLLGKLESTTDPQLRRPLLLALAATGHEKAIPAISLEVEEGDSAFQEAVADSFGKSDSPAASEMLLQLVNSEEQSVVLKALVALRRCVDSGAIPVVLPLAQHINASIRRHAIEVLSETGSDDVIETLETKLFNDVASEVRAAAARGLGRFKSSRSVSLLERALGDSSSVRCAAIISLSTMGDSSAIPALLASLKDPAPEVRYHAVSGLGKLKAEKATRVIQGLLEDTDAMVRRGAEKSLQELGVKAARVPLSRRMASRVARMVPDGVAGVVPTGAIGGIVAAVLLLTGGGWFLLSTSTAASTDAIALVRVKRVDRVLFVPGTGNVVIRRSDGQNELWDAASGEFLQQVEATDLLAVGQRANLFDRQAGQLKPWSPDGASGGSALTIPTLLTHMVLSSDGQIAVCTDPRRDVFTWNTSDGKRLATVGLRMEPAPVISSDGKFVAGVTPESDVGICDAQTGQIVSRIPQAEIGEPSFLKELVFSKTGRTLAVPAKRGVVIADVDSAGKLDTRTVKANVRLSNLRLPDAESLYSAFGENVYRINLKTGETKVFPLTDEEIEIATWSLSDDGSLIVAGDIDKRFAWCLNTADSSTVEFDPTTIPAE